MISLNKPSKSQTELTQLLAGPNIGSAGSAARRIAKVICARGSITAANLASRTGLARSTISTALTEMRQSGIVVETLMDMGPKDVGRPQKMITLNPDAGTIVGLHLSLIEINIAVLDVAHNMICKHTVPLKRDYCPEVAATSAYEAVQKLYEQYDLNFSGLLGVGVSVSGPVSPAGQILHSSILPTWAGQNVREVFEPIFQRPITAMNEANCSAIAEMTWGVAQGYPDFVFITIDLGVGGAVVQQGRIVTGVAGGAGEFGHFCVIPDGDICRCGNRGCLETIASFNRPLKELSKLHGRILTLEDSIELARSGDETAIRLIKETGKNAGWGLSIISTALNPPLIIIGGTMALAGALLMDPLIEAYERHVMIKSKDLPEDLRPRITKGHFTVDDSLRGAAGLVLHSIGDVLENKAV